MISDILREKLKKVKGEKKVLIAELRALREIGLYQGPLTRDGHEFSNAGAKEISDEHPQIEAGDSQLKNSTMEREKYDEVETEMLPYQIMLLELEERKRVIQSMLKADPGAFRYCVLLTIVESRSLQQLSLQLETQSQSILERIQTFTGSSSTPMNFAGSGAPLPSHEEWLQKSFQEWNSV